MSSQLAQCVFVRNFRGIAEARVEGPAPLTIITERRRSAPRGVLRSDSMSALVGRALDGAEWLMVLERLADALTDGPPVRIVAVGGAAMALAYQARRTTRDVDAVLEPRHAARIVRVANQVGEAFGLPCGWLNENAREAGYLDAPLLEGPTVLHRASLTVIVPTTDQLLALKLAAIRGQTDIDDVVTLLDRMTARAGGEEAIWSRVGGLVREADRANARHNLLKIWGFYDEPG
jgi:hypothetical protein